MRKLIKSVKGQYIIGSYDDEFLAFECPECKASSVIVNDPKVEQPNYCHGCGVKFDWEGVYEALIEEIYKEMEE